MEKNKRSNRFSPEARARAVRMVLEHQKDYATQWAAITTIAPKIGCAGETLRKAFAYFARAELDRPLNR